MTGLVEAIEKAITKLYRKRVSRRLYAATGKQVQYGPFKGLKFLSNSHIGDGPLALKAFGLYEQSLVDELVKLTGLKWLINIGAGDGYYNIALTKAGIVEKAVCFEMDAQGRSAIAENCALNNVADAVAIFDAADEGFAEKAIEAGAEPASTLVLCDIEGAEFDILNQQTIGTLSRSVFAVELHHKLIPNGDAKLAKLLQTFENSHSVEIIDAAPTRWAGMPEIEALQGLERALVTSEGRKVLGQWLLAKPK